MVGAMPRSIKNTVYKLGYLFGYSIKPALSRLLRKFYLGSTLISRDNSGEMIIQLG